MATPSWDELSATNPTELSWDSLLAEPPKEEPRGILRAVGDTALQFGKGAVSGVRMLTDLAGADNAVSGGLRSATEALDGLLSAAAQQDQRRVAEIMQEAEGKGWGDQIVAGLKAAGVAPGALLAQGLGTMAPTIAASLIPGVGPAAVASRIGSAGVGAAQGVGSVKGSIYETVKATPKPGESPEETEARAVAAQEYSSQNAPQMALGGALGAVAGSTGAERAVSALRNGITKSPAGILGRMAQTGIVEAVPEFAQGGQEKYATNTALANEGFDVDPTSGIIANATLEGLAGFGVGAGFGIKAPRVNEQKATEEKPAAPPAPTLQIPFSSSNPYVYFPDGTVGRKEDVDQFISRLPEDQQVAARAKLMGMGARDAKPEDILAAPDADSAIAAFTASLTGTDMGGIIGQANPLIAPAREMQAQAAADEADLADLAQTETRDLNALRAQLDQESRKQAELDALQATGTGQYGIPIEARPAVEQAAAVEAPTAMQLAMQRAKAAVIPNQGQPLPMTAPKPAVPAAPVAPATQRQSDILPADIARLDGKPFQTENGAKLKQREAGGVEKSDIVAVEGGFVVRPKPTQEPNAQTTQAQQVTPELQNGPAAVAPAVEGVSPGQPATGATLEATPEGSAPSAAVNGQADTGAAPTGQANGVDPAASGVAVPTGVAQPVNAALKPVDQRLVPVSKRAPTLMDKMTADAGGPVTFGDIARADAAQAGAANETSLVPERETASGWASAPYEERERFLTEAGMKADSEEFKAAIDSSWAGLGQEQRKRLKPVIDTPRKFAPPAKPNSVTAKPNSVTEQAKPATDPRLVPVSKRDAPDANPDSTRAKEDLKSAVADLGSILSKNTRATLVPEQEQKIMPALVRLFDAAARMGYQAFKDAVKYVVQRLRFALGPKVADQISQEELEAAHGQTMFARSDAATENQPAAEGRQYKLDTVREDRATGSRATLSADEVAAINRDAAGLALDKARTAALIEEAKAVKKRFPVKEGWAPIEVSGIASEKDDDGNIKVDKKGNLKISVAWKPISYGFNVPPGKARAGAKMDMELVGKVANQFTRLVDQIYARAADGDKNAQVIVGHQTWYRNVAAILRQEFGAQGDLFADLLGATSPNTPVDTNWRFAIEVLTRFTKGEFDAEMQAFNAYIEQGGTPSKFPGQKIRQASGKLYGMNSKNSMLALANLWRAVEAGTAPKARNFALNLIGQSNMATIDVWAARMLRRAAGSVRGMNLPRIPTVAEQGVTGTWNAGVTGVTGEFGFGAAVLDKVSADLAKKGIDLSPPDLQALAWFAEKELWTEKNWTSVQGEGGSFEENIESTPTSRYLMGFSVQQGDAQPEEAAVTTAQARLLAQLRGDDTVISARVLPTYGMFMGKPEEALDLEWTVKKGQHNTALVMAEAAAIAKERTQMAIFVSRVLAPDEAHPNARPGAEVYFKKDIDMSRVKAVMDSFTTRGLDGFTLAVDPRAKASARPGQEFLGLRIQYVPEFDDVTPETVDAAMAERRLQLALAVDELRSNGDVAFAAAYNYDTEVVSGESYDEYIDRAVAGDDRGAGSQKSEQSVRERLERAASRIQSDEGTNSPGGVPDAGSTTAIDRAPPTGELTDEAGNPGSETLLGRSGALGMDDNGRPQIITPSVSLEFSQATDRLEFIPTGAGQQIFNMAIMSPDGEYQGYVEALFVDGKPVALYDIDILPDRRNAGMGAKTVQALLDATVDGKLSISNIIPSAQDFWAKLGIGVQNHGQGAAYDGTITEESFAASTAGKNLRAEEGAARTDAGKGQERLARNNQAGRGVHIDDANAVVAAVREALPTAPTIHIMESVAQAPAELRKFIKAAGAENDVDAAYHQGEIYVFPANIPSIERMQFVLAHHEIRHHGLAAMLGPRKNAVMLKIHESNPKIRALASEQVRKGYAKSRILATEEALADMPAEDLVQLNGWDKVVAAVREWLRGAAARLRRAGLSGIADAIDAKTWTDKDVAALIARAEGVSRGGSARYASEGTVFADDGALARTGDQTSTEDTLFARSAVTGQPLAQTWQGPDESRMDNMLYTMQDKHIDTKRVVTAVRDAIGGIADNLDPYLQEELYHGRAAKSTKDFLEQSIRPLMVDMQARGVEMSDFEEYLHNRHAERRNVQVAKVNPNMQDGGSGIKTADARAYLAGLPAAKRAAYQALAKRVDQMTKETRALLVSSGLEKQSTIDAWDAAYGDEYVPLMREEMDNGAMGIGQGFSVRGGSSKRAMGSDKPVANILANIALQREKAITRSEKRRIGEALYGMVLSAPNPDFWFAVDPALQQSPAQITATSMQLISMGMNPIDAEQIAAEPTQRYIDPRTGQVASRINPALRSAENVLAVRMDGEDKYVFFNAKDPRAMRMAKALKNLDADQLGMVMGNVAKMTRYFAAVNTQWNPIFGVVNLTRDVQAALLNLQSTPLKGKQADVMKYVGSALRGIYIDLRDHRAGKTPTSTWANLFEEFQNEGGATGFRDMYANAQERADAIVDDLKKIKQGKAMAIGRGLFGLLSDYNESMENAVRVAAYKVAKEQGMTKQQAASLAKNLTVNFNRGGVVKLQAGALYSFFNAAVQGSARMAQTMFEPGKVGKLSGFGKKIMAGGMLLGSMQALLLAAAGYDDEEPPDFVRERSIVLPIGGDKYISIPMPLGFHVIPGLARIPTEWAMGGFKDTPKRIGQLVGLFADAFNPIGSAGLSLQTLTPTIIDPLAALSENRDWTGKPIAKKDFNSMQPTAGHLRAKDTATPWARAISYGVNWVTGGTDYKPGLASPTPDQIDYLIGQATGGVGREVSKLSQVAGSTVSGEELPLYKIPLLGRFVGTTAGQAAESGRFYSNLKEIGEHDAELTGLKKDRRMAEYQVYVRENPQARLVPIAERTYREVSKLNRAKRDAIKAGASAERVKLIDQQITARMKQFNDRVLATEKRETATQE